MTSVNLKKLDNMLDEDLEKETTESLNKWLSEKNGPIEVEIIIKRKKK